MGEIKTFSQNNTTSMNPMLCMNNQVIDRSETGFR
jgi:ABC-type dipeptide/oligopeptide/nickel transport system ATPase component